MALRLFVLTGNLDPPPSVLVKGRRAVIGRGEKADIRLPDPSVSLHHATILKRGEAFLLVDDGSAHGTGVSSDRATQPVWLSSDSPRVIEEGEHIWIGQIELRAHFEAAARGALTGYDELAPTLVRAGLAAVGLEPTDDLVEQTLLELTLLPEEKLEEPEPSAPAVFPSASFFEEEDRHPPWKTDFFVAMIALMILTGCTFGMLHLFGTN